MRGKYHYIIYQAIIIIMIIIINYLSYGSIILLTKIDYKAKTATTSPINVLFPLLVQKNSLRSPLVISAMAFF